MSKEKLKTFKCIHKTKHGLRRFTVGKSYSFERHNDLYFKCNIADDKFGSNGQNYIYAMISKESLKKYFIPFTDNPIIGFGNEYNFLD